MCAQMIHSGDHFLLWFLFVWSLFQTQKNIKKFHYFCTKLTMITVVRFWRENIIVLPIKKNYFYFFYNIVVVQNLSYQFCSFLFSSVGYKKSIKFYAICRIWSFSFFQYFLYSVCFAWVNDEFDNNQTKMRKKRWREILLKSNSDGERFFSQILPHSLAFPLPMTNSPSLPIFDQKKDIVVVFWILFQFFILLFWNFF